MRVGELFIKRPIVYEYAAMVHIIDVTERVQHVINTITQTVRIYVSYDYHPSALDITVQLLTSSDTRNITAKKTYFLLKRILSISLKYVLYISVYQ